MILLVYIALLVSVVRMIVCPQNPVNVAFPNMFAKHSMLLCLDYSDNVQVMTWGTSHKITWWGDQCFLIVGGENALTEPLYYVRKSIQKMGNSQPYPHFSIWLCRCFEIACETIYETTPPKAIEKIHEKNITNDHSYPNISIILFIHLSDLNHPVIQT